jgi:hypothetical protein
MKITTARVAWLIAGLVAVISVVTGILAATGAGGAPIGEYGSDILWNLVPIFFGFSGALILSSQPRNVIGWLLLTPAAAIALISPMELHLNSLGTPTTLSLGLYLEILIVSLSWVFLIFPLLHLLQVFPTGNLLSPKWRWLTWLEIVMLAVLLAIGAFAERVGAMDGPWTLENPVGFISQEFIDGAFMAYWTPGLIVLAMGGLASSIVRFRRGGPTERRQLGLVLYTIVVFALVYTVLALLPTEADESFPLLVDLLFLASIVAIPVVIAYAVLRRGLFEIEVIVRRTLVYGVLTGLLAAVYIGSVMVLRELLGGAAGADSSLSVAASTLLAAAVFSGARRRVQQLIDRQLFRSRYDSQQVVENFTRSLRDVADPTVIVQGVYQVIDQTVQPRAVALWIRDTESIPRHDPYGPHSQDVGDRSEPFSSSTSGRGR